MNASEPSLVKRPIKQMDKKTRERLKLFLVRFANGNREADEMATALAILVEAALKAECTREVNDADK